MQTVEQALITFFEQVAQKNKTQLQKLEQNRRFSLMQERWCFTLPDLYSYLQLQDDVFCSIDYQQFRRTIFNSPINERTKLMGAEITVADNLGKVDKSTYALVWHTEDMRNRQEQNQESPHYL